MTQVTDILSQQPKLAEKARQFTGDTNEAGLLVGKVLLRAFSKIADGEAHDDVSRKMPRDLEALIEHVKNRKYT